jgi:pimeloyl-ACP methyl ester carboxylesterase
MTMEMAVRHDLGSGTPIVLLHGFPGNGDDWEPVATRLADQRRVVVLDLLGFGGSARPEAFNDLWADAQARALGATLDRLGLDRIALVGHDMGGPVSLTFLAGFPDRVTHLGLLSTNAFGDTPVDFPLSLLRVPAVGNLVEPLFMSRWSLLALGRAASRTGGVRPARNDPGEARTIRTIFANVLRDLPRLYGPIEHSLGAIAVPTVVIWGDRDMFFPVAQGRRTAEAIPGAEFVALGGCGHFPPIERPDEVAAALAATLELSSG